jgi:hypothetical protein
MRPACADRAPLPCPPAHSDRAFASKGSQPLCRLCPPISPIFGKQIEGKSGRGSRGTGRTKNPLCRRLGGHGRHSAQTHCAGMEVLCHEVGTGVTQAAQMAAQLLHILRGMQEHPSRHLLYPHQRGVD